METIKFIMVGHIDHGKSTLIGRLFYDTKSLPPEKMEEVERMSKELGREMEFAFLMDHLQEEREQGITIDTAQIFFKTEKKEYVIIDAPGHVEFVKNMITGASQAEAGVLIIDADEGVQEQTIRHSYILSMLGLKQVIVIINKMDIVGYSEERYKTLKADIEDFFGNLNIKPKYYIPISALKGDNITTLSDNMPWYKEISFLDALDTFKSKLTNDTNFLLLPVQDIYKVDDKRIIVGKIESGELNVGDTIKILPDGQTTRVKTIELFLETDVKNAVTGQSIGFTSEHPRFINRGNVICLEDKVPELTDHFTANVFWLSKMDFSKDDKISIRLATQEVYCKIEEIRKRINSSNFELIEENASTLKNLEIGEMLIKTNKPIAITPFNEVAELGRFVLTRGENVCAGGIITRNHH